MKSINFKRDWKKLLGVVLIVATVVGIAGVLISNDRKDMVSISSSEFEVGTIDQKTGEYKSDNQSIYTSEAFNCIGLRIAPAFEFSGTYDVFYYDYNEHFIEAKLGLTGVYDEDYPLAKLARIALHPDVPADETKSSFEISWWEIDNFADLVDITVAKNQKWAYETINLYNDETALKGSDFGKDADGGYLFHVGDIYTVESDSNSTVKVSAKINISGYDYKFYDVYVKKTNDIVMSSFNIVAASNNLILLSKFGNFTDYNDGDWVKITLDVSDFESADHIRLRLPIASDCYVYGYN